MTPLTGKQKLFILLGGAVCVSFIVGILLARIWLGNDREEQKGGSIYASTEETRPVSTEKISYDFFFPSYSGDYLLPRRIEVAKFNELKAQVREVVVTLLQGPGEGSPPLVNPFSEKIRLNEIFLVNNVVVIDVNSALQDKINGGSTQEILTVYTIVDTVLYNFSALQGVQILLDGKECETLAGHIDIGRPLFMDSRWMRARE